MDPRVTELVTGTTTLVLERLFNAVKDDALSTVTVADLLGTEKANVKAPV